jgi:hypothetical protein
MLGRLTPNNEAVELAADAVAAGTYCLDLAS